MLPTAPVGHFDVCLCVLVPLLYARAGFFASAVILMFQRKNIPSPFLFKRLTNLREVDTSVFSGLTVPPVPLTTGKILLYPDLIT